LGTGQARSERPRAEWGSWEGQLAPLPISQGGLSERYKLTQRGPGWSPGRPSGFLHLKDARWLFLASQQCKHRMLVCYIYVYIAKNFLLNIGGVELVTSPHLNTAVTQVSKY